MVPWNGDIQGGSSPDDFAVSKQPLQPSSQLPNQLEAPRFKYCGSKPTLSSQKSNNCLLSPLIKILSQGLEMNTFPISSASLETSVHHFKDRQYSRISQVQQSRASQGTIYQMYPFFLFHRNSQKYYPRVQLLTPVVFPRSTKDTCSGSGYCSGITCAAVLHTQKTVPNHLGRSCF